MLTKLEIESLQSILNSDFMDGAEGIDAVGKPVWTWSANPFKTKRQFAGTVSSLAKKGFIGSTDEGDDSVIWITKAGLEALVACSTRS